MDLNPSRCDHLIKTVQAVRPELRKYPHSEIISGVEVKKLSPTPLMSLHRGVPIATPRPPNLVTVWGLRGMIFALVYCTAGIAVFLVHLATIPITGTGINPARSLGATIVYNRNHAWDDHYHVFINAIDLIKAPVFVTYCKLRDN
ncbi:hypothetical protein Goari_016485 [Gossypium aridum]|uniref:Uncharacterized protein n=1 Tax=Gossypium aridum TaxID=34290 RepID=A0A7J8WIV5_GOSAI|nr:hypothetical protein [Gossypium aridum]